ncbi:MAG: helix-turn-helix transcriptional regulator [bacterium]|nr:helix-turn-helix transcriptional regulator [bacterium]
MISEQEPVDFGEILRIARKRLSKNAAQMADELGVKASTVSRWETNKCIFPVEKFEAVSQAYVLDATEKGIISQFLRNPTNKLLSKSHPKVAGSERMSLGAKIFICWVELPKAERQKWLKVMQAYEASGVE